MTSISVIICTFNRCDSLVDTMASLQSMEVPPDIDWDIIVVDNNSTDRTRECVEAFASTSRVPVRYLLERTQGLSHARNLGIRSTAREYIAYTDDDILVDRHWLGNIVEAFTTRQVDCVGGRIIPHWLGKRPAWLNDNLLNVLAMLDYGDAAFEFRREDPRILFGANFAFRRTSLIDVGMFNVALGRTGQFGCGEDKDIFDKLRERGARAFYDPRIMVLHKVFPDRMNKPYFRNWHYAAGKDRARLTRDSRFTILGIESYLLRDFTKAVTALFGAAARGRWDRLFSNELNCILYMSVFKHKLLGQPGAGRRAQS